MKKILDTRLKDMKAITLIALVITIVVLIILATVAIQLSLGNNGIFNRAKTAKEQYQNATKYEEIEVAKSTNQINNYVGGNSRDTVTIQKDEYEALKKKGHWELIASSTALHSDAARIKTVDDLSMYSSFVLLCKYSNGYLASTNVDYSILKTGTSFWATYYDGTKYEVGVKYISDSQIELWRYGGATNAELYGVY